ncbi:MAG: hypothetical protein QRY72_05380 [Candidatus Rhabdochlamydia sp.]
MNKKLIHIMMLTLYVGMIGLPRVEASGSNTRTEVVNTDAGNIDFTFTHYVKFPGVFHKIHHINLDDRVVDLEDGSRWNISKTTLVKGWEKSKNLMITQNHSNFSTSRYALVNADLKLAVPASLIREPAPAHGVAYVKSVDRVNDIVTLSDGRNWIVHSSDRGTLSKITEHDRIIVGANTGENREKSPYILINTSNNHYVRAQHIE